MDADWRESVRAVKRADFAVPTVDLARALIGAVLVHDSDDGVLAGRIVETEAYLAERDPASHSHRGRTERNKSMFGSAGTAYVYLCYGMHRCFNVVTGPEGVGEAVLVRALEPVEGLTAMRELRGTSCLDRKLCAGPGNLTRALGLSLAHDGRDLMRGPLRLWWPRRHASMEEIEVGTRIGLTKAADLPLRFVLRASPFASATRARGSSTSRSARSND